MKSKTKKLNLSKYQVAKINSVLGGNTNTGTTGTVTRTKTTQFTTSNPTTPPTVVSCNPNCN
ncbi:MAG: hypothetical protein AAF611_23100 [Bacteroidota bacterium]